MTTYNAYGQLTVDEQLEIIDGIGDTDAELHEVPLEAILAEITRRSGKLRLVRSMALMADG